MLSKSQSRKASKLKATGMSLDELAKTLKTTVGKIRFAAKRDGWSTSRPPNIFTDKEVADLFKEGHTWVQIAHKLNTTVGYARCAAQRAGVGVSYNVRRFTDQEEKQTKKLFESDVETSEIAAKLGRSYQSVHYFIKRQGYWKNRRLNFKAWFTEKQELTAKRMLAKGATFTDVGTKLGMTYHQVRFALYRTDWYVKETKDLRPFTKSESDEARKMNDNGFLMKEIGDKLNRSKQMMQKMAKRYGWYSEVHPDPRMKSGQYKLRECKIHKSGIDKIDYYSYKYLCRLLARDAYKEYSDVIDPKGLRSKYYHVDHRYSIAEACSKSLVDPAIISHPANLCMLPGLENKRKSSKSSITFEQLLRRIEKFEKVYGVYIPNCEFYDAKFWRQDNIKSGFLVSRYTGKTSNRVTVFQEMCQ